MNSWKRQLRLLASVSLACIAIAIASPTAAQDLGTEEPPEVELETDSEDAQDSLVDELSPASLGSTLDPGADPSQAQTTSNLTIPVDQLALLLRPLTVEELRNEAAAWLLLLQTKVKAVSDEEIAVKREAVAITEKRDTVQAFRDAQLKLEEAQAVVATAEPGTPAYTEASSKVEAADQALSEAQTALLQLQAAEAELQEDETFKELVADAAQEQLRESAAQLLNDAQQVQAELPLDSENYQLNRERIRELELALVNLEQTQARLKSLPTDDPEHAEATTEADNAYQTVEAAVAALLEVFPGLQGNLGGAFAIAANTIAEPTVNNLDSSIFDHTSFDLASLEGQAFTSPDLGDSTDSDAANLKIGSDQSGIEPQPIEPQQLETAIQGLEAQLEVQTELKNQLLAKATELQLEQAAMIDRFNTVLDALDAKGGSSRAYRKYIQAVSGLQLDVSDAESLGLRLWEYAQSEEGGLRLLRNGSSFVMALILSIIVMRVLAFIVRIILERYGDESVFLRHFVVGITKHSGIPIGILFGLVLLGVDLGPIIALLGGASFILAFALQSNLGNFASGLMLMINKPFDRMDEIVIDGVRGWVTSITLASTRIQGWDGKVVTFPNNIVWSNKVENLTSQESRKARIGIRISYDTDIRDTKSVLLSIAQNHPAVLQEPAPETLVWEYGEYYIQIDLMYHTRTPDYWSVWDDIHCQIQAQFGKHGISITLPASIEFDGQAAESQSSITRAGTHEHPVNDASNTIANHGTSTEPFPPQDLDVTTIQNSPPPPPALIHQQFKTQRQRVKSLATANHDSQSPKLSAPARQAKPLTQGQTSKRQNSAKSSRTNDIFFD